MRNRFLSGISFLPLFGPADKPGGGDDQPQLQLDPADVAANGDPDWEANDPGDIGTIANDGDGDPDPDTGKPAADPEPEPVKAGAEADPEPEADPDKELSPEELKAALEAATKANKAFGKRISILSKEKQALSTKLQSTIKPVEDPAPAGDADGEQPVRSDFKTQAEFNEAVQAEADRRLAVNQFNADCNKAEAAGVKAFGTKWQDAKRNLSALGDTGSVPLDLLTVALETDDPAKVLFVLSNDLDKAAELMGMPVTKRAIAMDRIAAAKPHTETPKSKTPPPIEPIGGKGAGDDKPSDRDTDEEWNRKEEARERALAAKRKAQGY